MIVVEVTCINCKVPIKVDVLEPPEPRYMRCPACGAPHYLQFQQKTLLTPDGARSIFERKQ
jgi:DNA-directed RNA polymerase subunit RPC12/RpoP